MSRMRIHDDTGADGDQSDWQLILACRRGDTAAWERLLDNYERLVYSIPLNYGLSREDAADIVQLTFTSLIQRLDGLREDSRLSAWLATVARRNTWRVIEQSRRERAEAFEATVESEAPLDRPGGDPLERWELIEWLHQGLGRLDPRCREMLTALYFAAEPPSYAEVAARMNMPIGSISPTRGRCLERLRQLLQES